MNADLTRGLEDLEQRRVRLLARVGTWSEAAYRQRPRAGSWSLVEVAEHLMLAERATLRSITLAAARPPRVRGWYDRALNGVIARALESAIRIPVTGRILTPSAAMTLPELTTQWEAVRDAWAAYLSSIPEAASAVPVFRHPLGAVMTPVETLVFLRRHFDHHLRQVDRIERSPAFRAA